VSIGYFVWIGPDTIKPRIKGEFYFAKPTDSNISAQNIDTANMMKPTYCSLVIFCFACKFHFQIDFMLGK